MIPDFPFPVDDDGEDDNGTPVDLAWTEELHDAIQGVVAGADNPNVFASTIIDEVIEARGSEASLLDQIEERTQGDTNPGVTATDIVDEVVEARDDNPDLNDRLDNFVADEIDDATTDTRGLLSDGSTTQIISGNKTFDGEAIVINAGTGSGSGYVGAQILRDMTQRDTSGTGSTTLSTLTVPANTLVRNGQKLVFRANGKLPANGNNKTLSIEWNGAALITHTIATNGAAYEIEVHILRTGAATQVAWAILRVGGASTINTATAVAAAFTGLAHWDNLTADLTGAVTLVTKATAATAGTISQYSATVDLVG